MFALKYDSIVIVILEAVLFLNSNFFVRVKKTKEYQLRICFLRPKRRKNPMNRQTNKSETTKPVLSCTHTTIYNIWSFS